MNHKQHDRVIKKYKITYLEQILLICDGKLFKIFSQKVKWLQLHNDDTPEAMADETTRKQLLVLSLPVRQSILPEVCHLSSSPQSDITSGSASDFVVCMHIFICIRPQKPLVFFSENCSG